MSSKSSNSSILTVCEISEELQVLLKEFRFRKSKTNDALIMKVDKEKREIILEQEFVDTDIETLLEELPDHQPRFVLLSYKLEHTNEVLTEVDEKVRVSYPLCFIFITPRDCNPELQMMYAGSKLSLQDSIDAGGRVFEVRELEEFTEEWLRGRLLSR